jgi:hypothetical protein
MKRASYRAGVYWIAHNDDHDPVTEEEITGMISVALLADLFDVPAERIARDVIRERSKVCTKCNGTGTNCLKIPFQGCDCGL